MRAWHILKMRLRTLLERGRVESELEEELQHHLAEQARRNAGRGMTAAEAHVQAVRELGGKAKIEEECRDARGLGYLEDLVHDVRYGLRAMRRSPAVTAVAILSLALGIGANTAVFSLINAVMLRTLPVAHPEELVRFARGYPGRKVGSFSYPHFRMLQDANAGAADLFATNRLGTARAVAPGSAESEQVARELITGGYFGVLGVHAIAGRLITEDDVHVPSGNAVAVISYRYWTRRFGRDPKIVGKTLVVADVPLEVIGVAEPEFFGVETGSATDVWIPVSTMTQKNWHLSKGFGFLTVLARLKPGTGIAEVGEKSTAVLEREKTERLRSVTNARQRQDILDQRILVEAGATGLSRLREQFSEPLRVLLVIVLAVLLVACSNIANLQIARASAREREIAVRLAIGAARSRVVRQLLTESLLLAFAGGLCGIVVAQWGCQALLRFVPPSGAPLVVDVHPDARVLGFTLGLSVLAAILFGLGPALHSVRGNVDAALKKEGRSTGYSPTKRWLGRSLIAGQVAVSMLLLVGSGLFVRSLMKLQSVNLGLDREHVLTFGINVPAGSNAPQEQELIDRVVAHTLSIPGVRAASYAFCGGYGSGGWTTELHAPGYVAPPDEPSDFDASLVGPGYFEAMGIPLLYGRTITESDNAGAQKVVVINRSLARHFFGGGSALGRTIEYMRPEGKFAAEVVGVVEDVQHHGARHGTVPWFYAPALQNPGPWPSFAVRVAGDPAAITGTLSRVLKAMQPGLTVQDPEKMDDQVNRSLARERLVASISGFFAGIALLLACIGVYGTLSYAVTRRTAEVGIRMTLGARRSGVLWMVLREALMVVAGGVLAGALAARAATEWIGSLLFGLAPGDLTTIAIAATAMLLAAVAAGYLPAARAASVDPMRALRYE